MAKEALNTFWRVIDENVIIALNNGLCAEHATMVTQFSDAYIRQ